MVRLIVRPFERDIDRPDAVGDLVLGNVVHMCRMTSGDDFVPFRVYLRHSGATCRRRRQGFFGSPVEYGSEEFAIDLDPERIRRSLATANAELAHANERIIADYLSRLELGTTVAKVKTILVDHLPSGEATEEKLAATLHLSRSSLQRRLREEGTNYRAVLQEVRRELAEKMLIDGSQTLSEISFLLGFADLSAFSRAFKRWTGLAPSAYSESDR